MAETLFRQWFVEDAKEEWVTDTLGKLFDIGIGRTPPRKEHHWFSENPLDIKWVSIKDMGNSGVYISSVSEYLTKEAVDRFSIPIIPENTVMLSFKMTIGRLAITTEKMLSNEAIAHFKVKKNSKLFSEFLYLYLKTYQWEQLGSTSSIVEAINSQMIKEMEIIIPEENLLIGFKKIVEPYFQKIKSNQTQIRTLTALRDTLLPKLMSGELRVEMS
jgi:type I restriction enzyme S subunit